jgi:hypothetical protein
MADPSTQPKRNLTFTNMAGPIILYLHGAFAPHTHSCSEGLCAWCICRIYLASGPALASLSEYTAYIRAHPPFIQEPEFITGLIVWTGLLKRPSVRNGTDIEVP